MSLVRSLGALQVQGPNPHLLNLLQCPLICAKRTNLTFDFEHGYCLAKERWIKPALLLQRIAIAQAFYE